MNDTSDIYRGRPCYIIFSRKLKFFRTVGFAQAFAQLHAMRLQGRNLFFTF